MGKVARLQRIIKESDGFSSVVSKVESMLDIPSKSSCYYDNQKTARFFIVDAHASNRTPLSADHITQKLTLFDESNPGRIR